LKSNNEINFEADAEIVTQSNGLDTTDGYDAQTRLDGAIPHDFDV